MFCKGGSVALWFPIPTFFGWGATDLQLSRDPERIPIDAKNLEYLRHLSAMNYVNCLSFKNISLIPLLPVKGCNK